MHLQRCVLKVDGKPVSVGDVFAFEILTYALGDFRTKLHVACQNAAQCELDGISISQEDLEALFDQWRTDKNLISADDTEKWFELHGITMDDVLSHLERRELDRIFREREESPKTSSVENSTKILHEDFEEIYTVSVFLEGIFDLVVQQYAVQAAAPLADPASLNQAISDLLSSRKIDNEADFAAKVALYGVAPFRAREILELVASFNVWCKKEVTSEALEREIGAQKQHFSWFEIQTVGFGTMNAASEAIWCVKDEGITLGEIAERAELPCRVGRWFYTELMALPGGPKIISSRDREAVGPQEVNGAFVVYQVQARGVADLRDPVVLAKVREKVIQALLGRDIARRVQWPVL